LIGTNSHYRQLNGLEARLVKHVSGQLFTVVALSAGISGVIVAATIAVMQLRAGG
jgi:ribose/xylose/arabinose/galactoside ABC-type transport system permease subunit